MKKNRILVVVLAVMMMLVAAMPAMADDVIKIGAIQLVEHAALDAAYEGFVDGLAAEGFIDGENIEIDFQNAQADQSNMNTIADRFVNNNVDLILAIATSAAQTVAAKTEDIPILVTAVTDLVNARLVESNEVPGTNVSGTTDMNPIDKQIALAAELFPEAQTIGIIYNSSEDNSTLQAAIAKEEIEKLGLEWVEGTVTSVNDIAQVAESLVKKADVIYVPTDNTLASAMPNLVGVTDPAGIGVICGESNEVNSGGLATIGLDYYKLGVQTGAMAARILRGEAEPSTMPVESLDDVDLVINLASAEAIGFEFPEDVIARAAQVIE